MTHTHDDSPLAWGSYRMREHLSRDHNLAIPMSWDRGRLHQAHLMAHAAAPEPEPEPDRCGDYYGVGDGTATICQRPAGHPEVSEDGIGHSPQPIPIQEKPMPMPKDHDHSGIGGVEAFHDHVSVTDSFVRLHLMRQHGLVAGDEENAYGVHAAAHRAAEESAHDRLVREGKVTEDTVTLDDIEDRAQAYYEAVEDTGQADWDDVDQETRDYYRDLVRQKLAEYTELVSKVTAEKQPENPQVHEDRIICALAGVDFDGVFVRDESQSMRGALRRAYGGQARNLLRVIDRGGLPDLIVPGAVFQEIVHERAEQGRRIADLTDERDDARDERDRAQERLMEKLTEAGQLREQLSMTQTASTNLQQQVRALQERRDEALERLGEVAGERDRAIEAGRALEAQRDAAVQRSDELDTQVDLLSGDLEASRQELGATRERLAKRTKMLDQGRSRLREIVTEMKRDQAEHIDPHVPALIEALEGIAGGTVSTAAPIGIKCQEPHLGLATTGEMLTEITTRIDLGHCGLHYRTVDND
jgi:hypothetical protein